MRTAIIGLQVEANAERTAELACGHHVPHGAGGGAVGDQVDCPLCDRIAMPPGAAEYKRTATFTEETTPEGLRANHRTKAGTWAWIVVEEGALDYHVRGRVHRLDPAHRGLVEPQVTHHVSPVGAVRFHVAFHRVGQDAAAGTGRRAPGYMTEDLQPHVTGPAHYTSRTDGPVVHIDLADAHGRVIGHLYASDEDDAAGWVPHAGADPAQQNLAAPWMMLLREAKGRGLAPTAALDELMSATPANRSRAVPGSRRTSASIVALRKLAGH